MGLISRVSSRTYRMRSLARSIVQRAVLTTSRPGYVPVYQPCVISKRYLFSKKGFGSTATAESTEKTPPAVENEEGVEQEVEPCAKQIMIGELTAKNDKLQLDLEEKGKQHKYQIAEQVNNLNRVRERHTREMKYAAQKFAKDILKIDDDLARALDHMKKTSDGEENQDFANFVEGIEMSQTNLEKIYKKHGISKIATSIGDKFDSDIHDAAVALPKGSVPDIEPDHVAFVQETGWTIHDRTLRPVKVGVIRD